MKCEVILAGVGGQGVLSVGTIISQAAVADGLHVRQSEVHGMAHGAAEAGMKYSLAVVGDSTFLHSGITCLVDAVQTNTPMTVIILDNFVVAMTGCQKTIVPSENIPLLIRGLGVEPEHIIELEAKPNLVDENAAMLKKEMEYRGVSVVIFKRECLESFRKRSKAKNEA